MKQYCKIQLNSKYVIVIHIDSDASKPHTNRIITSPLKTHFVKNKHIKMRRNIEWMRFLSLLNI